GLLVGVGELFYDVGDEPEVALYQYVACLLISPFHREKELRLFFRAERHRKGVRTRDVATEKEKAVAERAKGRQDGREHAGTPPGKRSTPHHMAGGGRLCTSTCSAIPADGALVFGVRMAEDVGSVAAGDE